MCTKIANGSGRGHDELRRHGAWPGWTIRPLYRWSLGGGAGGSAPRGDLRGRAGGATRVVATTALQSTDEARHSTGSLVTSEPTLRPCHRGIGMTHGQTMTTNVISAPPTVLDLPVGLQATGTRTDIGLGSRRS